VEKSGLRKRIEAAEAERRLQRDIAITRQRTGNHEIKDRADLLAAVGQPVSVAPVISELTAEQAEHGAEMQREKPTGESTLATVFADYQAWRAEGGLKAEASSRVLKNEAGLFENYLKSSVLFNTPILRLDDTQAIDFLKQMKADGRKFGPRKESAKTLSQMASFLREKKLRRDGLLFQKISVTKSKAEKQGDDGERVKYYGLTEIPVIFETLLRLIAAGNKAAQEKFDAAATLYFGAFRLVDVKGDSAPKIGGLRWERISWEPFRIKYWNPKGETGGAWCTKHLPKDLKPILQARWERQGKPESGLVFFHTRTKKHFGKNLGVSCDWGLEVLIHGDIKSGGAGIEKQEKRSMHAFRHSGALAAASGAWGKKWTKDEVAKLLNDTSDAVQVYFDIADEAMHELASNTVSQTDAWGLTISNEITDAAARVTSKQPVSANLSPEE
jgi:hypothetical protein